MLNSMKKWLFPFGMAFLLQITSVAVSRADAVMGLEGLFPGGDTENALGVFLVDINPDADWAWFADGYTSGPVDEADHHYDHSLDEHALNDPVTDRKRFLTGFHIGTAYRLSDRFSGFAGLGWMWEEDIVYLKDTTGLLADGGTYSLEDETQSGFSISAGVLYHVEKVCFKAGYVSGADGFSLGMGLRF